MITIKLVAEPRYSISKPFSGKWVRFAQLAYIENPLNYTGIAFAARYPNETKVLIQRNASSSGKPLVLNKKRLVFENVHKKDLLDDYKDVLLYYFKSLFDASLFIYTNYQDIDFSK